MKGKMIIAIIVGVVIGGALGFANYRFIGCKTGTCPLSANPWISTFYGMLVGGMIGSAFK
jgi:Na+/H+ antiporter NhaA